jgi:hypothetical protein
VEYRKGAYLSSGARPLKFHNLLHEGLSVGHHGLALHPKVWFKKCSVAKKYQGYLVKIFKQPLTHVKVKKNHNKT